MKKITRFKDIPQFTKDGVYQVDMDIQRIPQWIKTEKRELNLQLNPTFQRGHVWTEEQQIAWLEFFLKGGKTGNVIYFNCPSWHHAVDDGAYDEYVCVDGLQRITAICRFINNEIKVFGSYFNEYEDPRILLRHTLKINVNNLKTEEEVLQWYIDMNVGGTPHTSDEIQKVKDMICELKEKRNPYEALYFKFPDWNKSNHQIKEDLEENKNCGKEATITNYEHDDDCEPAYLLDIDGEF